MIKKKRIEKNLTQNELSKILKINRSYVSKLENKTFNNPSIKLIHKISIALELDFNDLFNWFFKK